LCTRARTINIILEFLRLFLSFHDFTNQCCLITCLLRSHMQVAFRNTNLDKLHTCARDVEVPRPRQWKTQVETRRSSQSHENETRPRYLKTQVEMRRYSKSDKTETLENHVSRPSRDRDICLETISLDGNLP